MIEFIVIDDKFTCQTSARSDHGKSVNFETQICDRKAPEVKTKDLKSVAKITLKNAVDVSFENVQSDFAPFEMLMLG